MEQRHVSIKQLLSKPKRPIPQKDSKHENKKKTRVLKVILKYSAGVFPILSIFENTETQKYRINSICGKKNNFDVVFLFSPHLKKNYVTFGKV